MCIIVCVCVCVCVRARAEVMCGGGGLGAGGLPVALNDIDQHVYCNFITADVDIGIVYFILIKYSLDSVMVQRFVCQSRV